MKIRKVTGYIGAEISDLNLAHEITLDISLDLTQALREALSQHQVIFLRSQYLNLEQQRKLTKVFGPAMQLPYVEPIAEDPHVIAVLKEAHDHSTGVFGGEWHTDFSFLPSPPAGSILNAVEIPDVGGDTVWSSQIAAYESLTPELKQLVDEREAVHVGKPYGVRFAPLEKERASQSIKMRRGDPEADRETLHPAVITDPRSGRRALFVNPIYVTRFADMTEAESAPYLAELYKHAARPDFSCRLKWQTGDIAVWDNRMALHYATNDYDGGRRLLYRTTFSGPAPR